MAKSPCQAWVVIVSVAVLSCSAWGQETRGAVFGHVVDPQSTPVAGARVTVKDTETNVTTELNTNESGFYEANLLVAGTYQVMVEAPGFSKAIRKDLVLPVGTRLQVDVRGSPWTRSRRSRRGRRPRTRGSAQ